MLLVLDHHLQGLSLPGSRCIVLQEEQGLFDVGVMAVNQELLFLGTKVLLVITGCAEVEAQHPAMVNSVLAAMKRIQDNVPYVVVMAAPLPKPTDTVKQLKDLFRMTKVIQACCKDRDRFEFTKSGLLFYGPGGIYANLMCDQGLSDLGVTTLSNQLLDKLNSLGFALR